MNTQEDEQELINGRIAGLSPQALGFQWQLDSLKSMVAIMRGYPETYAVVLRTINDNLNGEDQELAEKTNMLLAADQELSQDAHEMSPMALAKTFEDKSGPLGNVQKAVLSDIGKYL